MISHLASTQAIPSQCALCEAPLLKALDEGLPARVDAVPLLGQAAELAALLAGKWTYTLTHSNHLIHRDTHRIAANTIQGQIHAEHRCETAGRTLF